MSFILDALRKSQQARQPGSAPGPRGAVHNVSRSLSGGGWWLAAGILLLFGIVIAALIFWRSTVGGIPVTPPPEAAPVVVAPPREEPVTAEKPPEPLEKISTHTPNNIPPVRDLAEQAKVPAPVAPKKATVVRPKRKAVAKHLPETPRPSFDQVAPLVSDDTPLLQQMSPELQRAIPPMAVTIHVYSPQESQRILFINNREYHKGDRIEGGIRVEEIVPDGVVLSYQAQRFKLSRPR